jgi:murein L,D-transpeptidase YafK
VRVGHERMPGLTGTKVALHVLRMTILAIIAAGLAACGQTDGGGISAASTPLSKEAVKLMADKGMTPGSPIFIRVFKEESELEVWKARDDGHFYHFKTYPICNWSGDLGPKLTQGDRQAPEGFYTVTSAQMNPNSNYYLSFNVGFPNSYDKAFGRTGSDVMVHGNCKSAGCYAMTDGLIEEIYGIAREAFTGGQKSFQLHAYPFRMTAANMERHKESQWSGFWKTLKQGYDYFEVARQPPPIAVCSKQYVVNARFTGGTPGDAASPCPPFVRPQPELWVSNDDFSNPALTKLAKAPGIKTRNLVAEASFASQTGQPAGNSPAATGWDATTSGKMGLGGAVSGFTGSN